MHKGTTRLAPGIDSPRTYRSVVKGSPVQIRRGPATVTGWRSSRAPSAPATGGDTEPPGRRVLPDPGSQETCPRPSQFNPRGKGGVNAKKHPVPAGGRLRAGSVSDVRLRGGCRGQGAER